MRKKISLLLAAGALLAPAAALAAPAGHARHPHPARTVARQECRSERTALGKTAFRTKYGTPNAVRKCVIAKLPAEKAAAATCRTERKTIGKAAFQAKYGKPGALTRCVKANMAA